MKKITIALDAMGGDFGPRVVVVAAVEILKRYPDIRLILVGDEQTLKTRLRKVKKPQLRQRLEIQHASQVVEMHELPAQALRYKKDSSMRIAINMVKQKRADAIVSAGNTGALMATARFVLKMLPGIDRPAIMIHVPADNPNQMVRLMDVGANVDSTAQQLMQFAIMGSAIAHAVGHIDSPRVALLNIGEEIIKGNEQVKQTAELLTESGIVNYVGFAEGNDIFKDVADVVVCDGFAGNIALKASEGTARLALKFTREQFMKNWFTMLAGVIAKPVLNSIQKRVHPSSHNGGSFLGLRGIVVKSHGGARAKAFVSAIERAIWEVENNVIHCIEEKIADLLGEKA
ncbi:MAG: phosphate acyltransferase PlsX [Gammaproteobacteria bacterium]|nr:phosphate acyltransferase PlsX [Gammaproteobacteria bacterium]